MTRVPLVSRRWALGAAAVLAFSTMVAADVGPQTTSKPTSKPTSAPPTATASTPAAPTFVRLTIVNIRPDMMADYVALQKSDMMPALQKAGVEWRDAWRTGVFGTSYTIAFVAPLGSFASLDGPNPVLKAMGEDGYRQYQQKLAKLVTATRTYALRARPDLGYKTEGAATPKLGVLASVEVLPGRTIEFETILKNEWTPALKKAGVPLYSVSQVVFGGSIGEYFTFTPIENYAQLDKGHPIQQTLGEAGMNKLLAKMGGSLQHAERIIIRYDDELSFKTKTTSQVR